MGSSRSTSTSTLVGGPRAWDREALGGGDWDRFVGLFVLVLVLSPKGGARTRSQQNPSTSPRRSPSARVRVRVRVPSSASFGRIAPSRLLSTNRIASPVGRDRRNALRCPRSYSYSYSARRAVLVLDPDTKPLHTSPQKPIGSSRSTSTSTLVGGPRAGDREVPGGGDWDRFVGLFVLVLVLSPKGGTRTRAWGGARRVGGEVRSEGRVRVRVRVRGGLVSLKSTNGSCGHSPHRQATGLWRLATGNSPPLTPTG
jgi:hypothetical protein